MTTSPDRPWEPERSVDEALARRLIARQFPELAALSVEPYGVGWDNTAFVVGRRWVFRFPRRTIAVALVETECAILPALAPRLPLPLPVPVYLGRPGQDYPWPFAGYRELAGTTADRASPDAAARIAAAPTIAGFLAALHRVPAEEARALGAGSDAIGRLDLGKRVAGVEERLVRLAGLGVLDDPGRWQRIVDDLPAGWVPGDGTLCHGDLYARHLLVDDLGAPCGVIDWGDLHVGDPAVDLAIAHVYLPPAAHDEFRRAYGPIDEAAWRVARFRALFSAVAIVLYGHDVGDQALVREGRIALGYLEVGGAGK
jgi:aminoglycoside phosphotransferase (APT) family kinase protein